MRHSALLGFLMAAVCVPTLTAVASAQQDSPEAVVQEIMAATRANDWARVTQLMHPAALRQMRTLLDPILTTEGASLDTARQMLFGFPTRAAAAAATDSAVMAGLLRFGMSQQRGAADALRTATYEPLGTVREGADTVHVLGRVFMTVRGSQVSQIEVTSLARSGQSWRALLKGDWTQMASRLRDALLRAH